MDVYRLEKLLLLKYSDSSKLSIDSVQSLSKFQSLLSQNRKSNQTIYVKPQKSWITKTIFAEKSKSRGTTPSNIKLYYKSIASKTICYWHKDRHINE